MMQLYIMDDLRAAQAFVDYMATKSRVVELRPGEGNQVELWVADDQNVAEVQQELQHFLQDPFHPRYSMASWQLERKENPLYYPRFSYWQRLREGGGVVTHSVTLLCIAVYLLMNLLGDRAVMEFLAYPNSSEQSFQLWRLVTPALLHFSIEHIIFNLVMWWYLGGMVERRLGSHRLLLLALLAAVLSSYAQSRFSGSHFGGLSGVVYALIGYVWLMGERAPAAGLTLPRAMMVVILLWFIIDYFDVLGPIGNAAHLSGLLLGLLLAWKDSSFNGGLRKT